MSATVRSTLALRGLLEFATLIAVVFAVAEIFGGVFGVIVGGGVSLVLAAIWGTFTVPADPSRGGGSPVPVAGWVRLTLELIIFGFGVWALWVWLGLGIAIGMAFLTVVHYASWPARIKWLLSHK